MMLEFFIKKFLKNNYKFRCFTLSEMLVVMAITSMVIMLAYTSYTYIEKIIITNQQTNDRVEKLLTLNSLLINDFDEADEIIANDNTIICKTYNGNEILYKFEDFGVIRLRDTFNVNILNHELIETEKGSGLVNGLKIVSGFMGNTYEFLFYKSYSNGVLTNNAIEQTSNQHGDRY